VRRAKKLGFIFVAKEFLQGLKLRGDGVLRCIYLNPIKFTSTSYSAVVFHCKCTVRTMKGELVLFVHGEIDSGVVADSQ
jgi:hypothetical protein